VGIGEDGDRLHPPGVLVVGVAEVGEDVGDPLHPSVEHGDDREGRSDEEAAHAVRGGTGRAGDLARGILLLALGGGLGVARRDEAGDEVLEAGPGDAAVRRLRTALVDVGRLVAPQLGQPDHQVEGVGHH
jgi:hypothetical protein